MLIGSNVKNYIGNSRLLGCKRKYNNYLAIANRLHVSCMRTQYVEGINSNPVTLKSRLRSHKVIGNETIGYLTLNVIVTLKCGIEVTQGH